MEGSIMGQEEVQRIKMARLRKQKGGMGAHFRINGYADEPTETGETPSSFHLRLYEYSREDLEW